MEKQQFVKVNTNTNSLTLFGNSGANDAMLKISYYDESISLAFGTGVTDSQGKTTYPKENRDTCLLTSDRVSGLYDGIIPSVLNALEEKKEYKGGVFTNMGKTSVFQIEVDAEQNVSLSFCSGIDENRKPKKISTFSFRKSSLIENYNTETGDFTIKESNSQFVLFVKTLDGFVSAINGAYTHADRYSNVYLKNRVLDQIKEIAVKLGLTPLVGSTPMGGAVSGNNGAWGMESSTSNASVTTVESLSDILS